MKSAVATFAGKKKLSKMIEVSCGIQKQAVIPIDIYVIC
jgi:hypothetical protein